MTVDVVRLSVLTDDLIGDFMMLGFVSTGFDSIEVLKG